MTRRTHFAPFARLSLILTSLTLLLTGTAPAEAQAQAQRTARPAQTSPKAAARQAASISTTSRPAYEHDITRYGAVADGRTLSTAAVQQALDAARDAGGGTVIVPPGTFLIGTIFIGSHTTVRLEPGAVLLGSTRLADYTPMTWGHHEDRTPWHLIVARNAERVTIEGQGTIDGNGPSFWEKDRPHEWHFFSEKEDRPSPMVEIVDCKFVTLRGITIRNSAGWTVHPLNSEDILIDGITIRNTLFGPNADGIDVSGCRRVVIQGCNISTGDDAIALKTTEDSNPIEHVTITNCVLETSCVAVRVGYESRKDIRHVTVSNIVVLRCSRVIDIRSIEGAVIEHINIHQITGTTNSGWPINRVVEIDLGQIDTPYPVNIPEHPNYKKPKPTPKIGAIRHVSITGLDIVTDGRIMMAANDGHFLEDIRLRDIRLRYAHLDDPNPLSVRAQSNGYFKAQPDVRQAQACVVAKNVRQLDIEGLRVHWPTYPLAEGWHLLSTEWRKLNPEPYADMDGVRTGRIRPDFSLLWARNVQGGRVDLASSPQQPPATGAAPAQAVATAASGPARARTAASRPADADPKAGPASSHTGRAPRANVADCPGLVIVN